MKDSPCIASEVQLTAAFERMVKPQDNGDNFKEKVCIVTILLYMMLPFCCAYGAKKWINCSRNLSRQKIEYWAAGYGCGGAADKTGHARI
jgi:hypothetical protein